MLSYQNSTHSEKKQFKLVRYFACTSFIVLIISCLIFSVLISRSVKDVLINNFEVNDIPLGNTGPITGEKRPVGEKFEFTRDLTSEYDLLVKLRYYIILIFILMISLIFVILLLIISKAEKIMENRTRKQIEFSVQQKHSEHLASIGQMIAGVSHEIRNPLGIIFSTAELLSGMHEPNTTQKRLSDAIIDSSNRLNNIITAFQDFARPQQADLQECYIEEIINKGLNFLRPELDKQTISIQDNLKGKSFRLKADPNLLYRAFLNIFVNAVQAMENGGVIRIDLSEGNDHYQVKISNSGQGIGQDVIGKIFNPFFSSKDKGIGLGLPIAKNIIKAHNGEITLNSDPNSGTDVVIILPK